MDYEIITNKNFDTVSDYQGLAPKYYDRKYGHKREGDKIIFEANFLCCPCIYWIKEGETFCFSFDPDSVAKYGLENGIEISDDYRNFSQINDNLKEHVKPSIKKHYKYNLNYIEGWKKVILNKDGSFEVEKNDFVPFQLNYRDGKEAFYNLLNKYKVLIDKLIDEKLFLPTITGGLDTRGFIYFYKNRVKELDGYFLTSVKQDGKNNVEQGLLEMKLAEQVVNKIGLKNNRFEKLEGNDIPYVTLSGFMNENSELYEKKNDIDYVYKIVQHAWDNSHQFINKITIFMDDDYLRFKPNGTFRWMLMTLCPDLLLIPFVSGTSLYRHFKNGACIYPTFAENIEHAIATLKKWNK